MDKVTRKWLKQRVKIVFREIERTGLMNIEKLADNFRFDNRRISYPEECDPFYKSSKFCHDGDDREKYCLLCSCPNYDANIKEGRCLIENPCGRGYYYDRTNIGMEEIWDCSDCTYPHQERFVKNYLRKLFRGELIEEQASSED